MYAENAASTNVRPVTVPESTRFDMYIVDTLKDGDTRRNVYGNVKGPILATTVVNREVEVELLDRVNVTLAESDVTVNEPSTPDTK